MMFENEGWLYCNDINALNDLFKQHDKYNFIYDIEFEKSLLISNFKEEITKTQFSDCQFNTLEIVQNFKSIIFINCHFEQSISFSDSNISYVLFENCSFSSTVIFEQTSIIKLIFKKNRQISELTTEFLQFKESRAIESSYIKNDFLNNIYLKTNGIRELNIHPGKTEYDIYVSGNKETSGITTVTINYHSNSKTNIILKDFEISHFYVEGINSSSTLIIKNIKVSHVYIRDFSNYGIVKVSGISPYIPYNYGEIHIWDSSLGKIELFNTNFAEFVKVRFHHVNFIDLNPVNVTWCDHIKDISNMFDDNDDFSEYREIYRQLKSIMARTGNKSQELVFERNEMTMHLYYLRKNPSLFKIGERAIIWSNKVSNDFGQSWITPAFYIFSVNIVLYAFTYWLSHNGENKFSLTQHFANYLEFMSPIHDYRKLFNLENLQETSGLARSIDIFSKALNSYLIFQLIKAFRRFSK